MDEYAEVYEDIRQTHGDRFVSMVGPNTAREIQQAIDLHKLMTDEEKDMLHKVKDNFPALVEHISKVRARVGLV